jgi:AcrR family transcriptional regulator
MFSVTTSSAMKKDPDRPYHHGDLRQAVLDTAMQMLNEGEGSRLTLREVARRAGVSHAAPYKHFSDKPALLAEIALIGFDRLREALVLAQSGVKGDLLRELDATSRAYLRFGQENPALYRLMFGGDIGATTSLHLDPRAMGAFQMLTGLLERCQEAALIRSRPVRGQAAACWSQLHGLTMLTLDGLLVPEKVGASPVDDALQTLLEGLKA